MASGFDFSVSNIIKGIELVGIIINSLQASGQAKREHRKLLCQLHTLEAVYLEIKDLCNGAPDNSRTRNLASIIAQCHEEIDEFWLKNWKYQNLSAATPRSLRDSLQGRWRTVEWALYKDNDIEALIRSLGLYTGQLQFLIALDQR